MQHVNGFLKLGYVNDPPSAVQMYTNLVGPEPASFSGLKFVGSPPN